MGTHVITLSVFSSGWVLDFRPVRSQRISEDF